MYTIAKQFHFSASHQLTSLPPSHKCSRLHGHNYVVELILSSPTLNQHGFVEDYADLAPFAAFVAAKCDHRHLNEFLQPATAEKLAWYLWHIARSQWPRHDLVVRVSETPGTWAVYSGEDDDDGHAPDLTVWQARVRQATHVEAASEEKQA